MSNILQLEDEISEFMRDGKQLTKSELKRRLFSLDVEFDDKDHKKQYYVDLYNKTLKEYDKPKKTKDSDKTEDKNLAKKRKREAITSTPEFLQRLNGKDKSNKKLVDSEKVEKEEGDIKVEKEDEEFGEIKNRNLNLDVFMDKINQGLNDYKTKYKKVEGGSNNSNTAKEMSNTIESEAEKNRGTLTFKKDYYEDKPITTNFPTHQPIFESANIIYPSSFSSKPNQIPPINISNIGVTRIGENQEMKDSVDSSMDSPKEFVNPNPPAVRRNVISMKPLQLSGLNLTQVNKRGSSASQPYIRDDQDLRKSLPGSTKNIQEILKKIDINPQSSISPRLDSTRQKPVSETNKNISSHRLYQSQSIRDKPYQSAGGRSIIVNIRPTSQVSEFIQKDDTKVDIKNTGSFMKQFFNEYVSYLLLAGGAVVVVFLYTNHKTEVDKFLINNVENLNMNYVYLIVGGLITLYLLKKLYQKRRNEKIAEEDYELLKSILSTTYSNEESPLGLFVNNFTKDFSTTRKMKEGYYKKYILPLLIQKREKENIIVENEILIQGQGQLVWRLRD